MAVRDRDRRGRDQGARGRPQGTRDLARRGNAPFVTALGSRRALLGRLATFALALGLWFTPIPSGLTSQAWHLFAIFAAAIFSVIVTAFPLLKIGRASCRERV